VVGPQQLCAVRRGVLNEAQRVVRAAGLARPPCQPPPHPYQRGRVRTEICLICRQGAAQHIGGCGRITEGHADAVAELDRALSTGDRLGERCTRVRPLPPFGGRLSDADRVYRVGLGDEGLPDAIRYGWCFGVGVYGLRQVVKSDEA
jgi:hypothetical protein